MTNNDDSTYIHDPEAFREHAASETDEAETPRTTKAYLDSGTGPENQEFGRGGWLLVVALFFAFLVIPATILYLPHARPVIASLGLTFRDAYLVLPLVPALVLGAMAVWVAVGGRTE
ncbi:hypothetical protein [Halocatena marina]|uniref:hypothetical protein n=1 Tax=Halocatena marina TaxID=2934937 RepID=UPI00200F3986|nr:hypothetical protein [Halocatena marina]